MTTNPISVLRAYTPECVVTLPGRNVTPVKRPRSALDQGPARVDDRQGLGRAYSRKVPQPRWKQGDFGGRRWMGNKS
jgi:hypothetical protein